jgi:hypothetical protein
MQGNINNTMDIDWQQHNECEATTKTWWMLGNSNITMSFSSNNMMNIRHEQQNIR